MQGVLRAERDQVGAVGLHQGRGEGGACNRRQDKDRYAFIHPFLLLVSADCVTKGYQICLRLLRSGFTVICVSRFPNDTARRYLAESDAETWRAKLHVYGVDLRHLPSVYAFIEQIKTKFPRLDLLVNNAAQTIRRPRAYYRPLVDFESKASTAQLPGAEAWRGVVANANSSNGDVVMQPAECVSSRLFVYSHSAPRFPFLRFVPYHHSFLSVL